MTEPDTLFCGKGGVGKSTLAAAFALHHERRGVSTAIVDYDTGHTQKAILGLESECASNTICRVRPSLALVTIDRTDFVSILEAKAQEWSLDRYLAQFPRDRGIEPYADMLASFFGAPTDIDETQKFVQLVISRLALADLGMRCIVIDVEPTAGLARLFANARAMGRALNNIKQNPEILLWVAKLKWPDVVGYIQGDYIRNAPLYFERIQRTVDFLLKGTYVVVCNPKKASVDQIAAVERIIKIFGGKVHGYVVNDVWDKPFEKEQIVRVKEPKLIVRGTDDLHGDDDQRRIALRNIGAQIVHFMPKNAEAGSD